MIDDREGNGCLLTPFETKEMTIMSVLNEKRILEVLSTILDPDLHKDIVSLGFIKELKVTGGNVSFQIELTTPACPVKDKMKAEAEDKVSKIQGVKSVDVHMTASVRSNASVGPLIPGVKNIIAVASGKGGVGKSTVSCNLAIALAESGAKVGLLDSDIYGPSIPMMMGVDEEPYLMDNKIIPIERYGVKMMSMGFFLESDKAVLWRGPMIAKYLQQVLADVAWDELDYLVVDLPPGTGDAPMSLAQLIPLTGVVVVMTPQDVAKEIANKSIIMFRMMSESTQKDIPILGIIENMSGFVCPHCGTITQLFSQGGGKKAAEDLEIPFLGAIPIDPLICQGGDSGKPAMVSAPASESSKAFRGIAQSIAARISSITWKAI